MTGEQADFSLPVKPRQQEKLYSSAFFERSNFYSIPQSDFLSFVKYVIGMLLNFLRVIGFVLHIKRENFVRRGLTKVNSKVFYLQEGTRHAEP